MGPLKILVSYLNKNNHLGDEFEINLPEDNVTADELLATISNALDIKVDQYDLYCGLKSLSDTPGQNLAKFGIRSGCKLYAVGKKNPPVKSENEQIELEDLRTACRGLQMIFEDSSKYRAARSIVTKMLEETEMMQSIIGSIGGLAEDRVAIDVLENIKLFEVMVDIENAEVIAEMHPGLGAAIVTIWESVASSIPLQSFKSPSTGTMAPISNAQPSTSAGRFITSSQLEDAITQAISLNGTNPSQSSQNASSSSQVLSPALANLAQAPATNTSQSQSQSDPSSSDDFNQIMQEALATTGLEHVNESLQDTQDENSDQALMEEVMQAGLNQLRAMGITDDITSRQALEATHGNVEAALNLIFSS